MLDIISASRREDMIANIDRYHKLQEIMENGQYKINNNFNKKIGNFDVNNVGAVCLWSKDYKNFLLNPGVLDSFNLYFNFTITGHSKVIEPGVLNWKLAIEQVKELANKYGADKINWRFDPICLLEGDGITSFDNTELGVYGRFVAIAKRMKEIGVTRCTISFLSEYDRVIRNLNKHGFKIIDSTDEDKKRIANNIAELASDYNIQVYACSNPLIVGTNVNKGCCIDGKLLEQLFNLKFTSAKDKSQRAECGCNKSKDVGVYTPCQHKCVYCYANPQ